MFTQNCRACHTEKPLHEFSRDKTMRSGFRGECKTCHNARQRADRRDNPEKYRQYDKNKWQVQKGKRERRQNLGIDSDYTFKRRFLDRIKITSGCSYCDEHNPRALSFHHQKPEEKLFTVGFITGKTLTQLKDEIRKCSILCENCHRKQHAEERRGTTKNPRHKQVKIDTLLRIKQESGCQICGERNSACLDFHHRNEKNFTIGENLNKHSLEEILSESLLCDVICANCHRKIHNK